MSDKTIGHSPRPMAAPRPAGPLGARPGPKPPEVPAARLPTGDRLTLSNSLAGLVVGPPSELPSPPEDDTAAAPRLAAAEQERFAGVAKALAGDPTAAAALQRLHDAGRLTGHPLDRDGGTLLDNLARLVAGPHQPPLDGADLAGHVAREVDAPARIHQGEKQTCAATTAQTLLAISNGAEYARVLGGLAAVSGRVALPGPAAFMQRVPGTERAAEGDGRAATARLFQSAAMELANGPDLTYDVAADVHRDAQGEVAELSHGLTCAQNAALSEALGVVSDPTPREIFDDPEVKAQVAIADEAQAALVRLRAERRAKTPPGDAAGREEALQERMDRALSAMEAPLARARRALAAEVERAVAASGPVQVGIAGHCVLVMAIDEERVLLQDPTRGPVAMARKAFDRDLHSATLPTSPSG